MVWLLFLLLISSILCQDYYEELMNETVSEEYCNSVIGNMTALISEGYVYLDFLKAPKQPRPNYFRKMDLIKELNSINRTNRTFYEFYGDILEIIGNTGDGHFKFFSEITPNNFSLYSYYFCIPFYFLVQEVFDKDNVTINDTYLTINLIQVNTYCREHFTNETISEIQKLSGKKIISINNMNPYEYIEKITKNVGSAHSKQCKFIQGIDFIYQQFAYFYPHKKEYLNISIKFEGEDKVFETQYSLEKLKFSSEEFKEFFLQEQRRSFKNDIPFLRFEEIEEKFKMEKGLKNKLKDEKDIWDLKSEDEYIKCKVDDENKFNVIYQESFYPKNFNNYEDIMYKCFSRFYSNDYKIIIIENRNGGGMTEICIPFTQYLRPKISKPLILGHRATPLILKNFFVNDENLNPETCFTYTEKDDILNGYEDIYNDGIDKIVHKRTKNIEPFSIFEKKIMEKKRKEYLATRKTKKPTDILVFTDGYSFSCTSTFITGLQTHGHGIIVGYNARPDLNKSDFDASQSNSPVETFQISENAKNLKKLGFDSYITFGEYFDPNDKEIPRTPIEFLIYPVDEISNIYQEYYDRIYNRFIKEAKRIFEKYNDNGECNPDNKYLYFETSDCDSKINISKAHGGYICGTDGKWDKNNCIAAYCDDGYYLNDNRTECIKDPCDNIKLNEITINEEKEKEYIIEPNNTYIFTIEKENYLYSFYSELEPFIYIMNKNHILEAAKNGTKFKNGEKIYINYYLNITENINISIKAEYDGPKNKEDDDKGKGLPTHIIVLIIVGSLIVLIIIIIIIICVISKKKKVSNSEIEEKTQQLNPIQE